MAAGSTYTPIATTTLGSATASVTFNSFSGYTDIVAVLNPTRVTADTNATIRFNSDSGTNYSWTQIYGDGTSAISDRTTNATYINLGYTNTTQPAKIVYIQNYGNSSTYKTVLVRHSNASTVAQAIVGMWRNTAAITSITFALSDGNNLAAGSTFTLYGIAAA